VERFDHLLHPVYGAIPRDGDYVERGDILGLSVDTQHVVTAPFSGWVRLLKTCEAAGCQLRIEVVAAPAKVAERPPAA